MRCGPGFDEGAAAGVGGLFGGVDATCANSHTLGPEVFDSSMTITGSGIGAPTASAADGDVKGTRRQGSHRIVHTLTVVGFFG